MKLLNTEPALNYDGRPASRCPECGGVDFHENAQEKILRCSACEIPTGEEISYRAVALNGRLRWQRTQQPTDRPTTAGAGGAGGGGAAAGPTPTEWIYASADLAWFSAPLGTLIGRDLTVVNCRFAPDGVYRRVDRDFFGWLRRRAAERHGDAADAALMEIAVAAHAAGIFGDWANDVRLWPEFSPPGYVGPRFFELNLPDSWSI